jgi:energy-coupling factor transporter ATP-binding protein EcfA2
MIRIENLTYAYPAQDSPALRGLDLEVPEGQLCAVVGANGAGKSTLCYALSGFVPHFYRGELSGSLQIAGIDIAKTSLGELAGEVGLVFQNPFNQISGARFSVREEIAFGLENLGLPRAQIEARVEAVLRDHGLEELAERSPFELSGGQQQRVAIASILVMRPKVLVLDEPTSQLDPHGTEAVFKIVDQISRRGDTTVVLVEHKLEWLAEFADRVVVLDKGGIVMDGTPQEVLSSQRLQRLGIGHTQYTSAASSARKRRLVMGKQSLPITLRQAKSFFK